MQGVCTRCARCNRLARSWTTRLDSDSRGRRLDSHAYFNDARRYNSSNSSSSGSSSAAQDQKQVQNPPSSPKLFPVKFNLAPLKIAPPKLVPKLEGFVHMQEPQPVEHSRFDFDQPNPRKKARPPPPVMEARPMHGDTALGLSEVLEEHNKSEEKGDAKALFGILAGWVLRHEARNMGYGVMPDGFVRFSDLLRFPPFSSYTSQQLARLAESDQKDRFEVARLPDFIEGVIEDAWWMRARDMHSIPGVNPRSKRIIKGEKLRIVEYRTKPQNWNFIEKYGIPEGPDHLIRLYKPPGQDLFQEHIPESTKILSITIDTQKALDFGVTFYHTNDVRLYGVGTPGGGVIPLAACRSAVLIDVTKEPLAVPEEALR